MDRNCFVNDCFYFLFGSDSLGLVFVYNLAFGNIMSTPLALLRKYSIRPEKYFFGRGFQ
ncbi:hypothetical protein DSUL_60293 [Desulfovibrionales bacterium]